MENEISILENGVSITRDGRAKIIIRLEPWAARRLRKILHIVSTANILDFELFCTNEKIMNDLFNTDLRG